ncbi:MAG: sulfotransferase [Arenicella sp.]|nr:sulfotransferase [Arenicella sp.]
MKAQDHKQTQDEVVIEAKKLIRKGQFEVAITAIKETLSIESDHIEAMYCMAICHRHLKSTEDALFSIKRLLAVEPGFARAYQERGYVFMMIDETASATVAFEKAVHLNPSLYGSWQALSEMPNYPQAKLAKAQAVWLKSLPPELVGVASYIYEEKLLKAETLCRSFLKRVPHHPEAMRLLARLADRFQILNEAEFLLESCVEFQPDFIHARFDYVGVLHKRQKFDKALEQAKRLNESDPNNPAFTVSLANAEQATGDFDAAIKNFQLALKNVPLNPSLHVSLGHALKTIGRTNEAINAYRDAYKVQPNFGDAYWSLANLKTYQFTEDEITKMREAETAPEMDIIDQVQICFALGKSLEDQKNYAESFKYYERGNMLKKQKDRYDSSRIEAELDFQINTFDKAFFADRTATGIEAADPIFIVGLPRAGSTLLEQILASHSMVDGTMELFNIIGMSNRLSGGHWSDESTSNYPEILGNLSPNDLSKMGEEYIEDTRRHRQGAPFFIDKMPNNFRHIGLIHMILPNAKIIDARRHPMACCFSAYKQFFAEGQEFSYNLEDIGRYYQHYVEVMAHWDDALPGRILRVQHEDVIDDLETQVHRILDYCGLPFEQACIDFHKTERAVRTPSSEQVRQPIYQSGMSVWKNYEPYLGPLKEALK